MKNFEEYRAQKVRPPSAIQACVEEKIQFRSSQKPPSRSTKSPVRSERISYESTPNEKLPPENPNETLDLSPERNLKTERRFEKLPSLGQDQDFNIFTQRDSGEKLATFAEVRDSLNSDQFSQSFNPRKTREERLDSIKKTHHQMSSHIEELQRTCSELNIGMHTKNLTNELVLNTL